MLTGILSDKNKNGVLTLLLLVAFAMLGLWYGTPPDAAQAATFGDVLKAFARDQQTKTILIAILIDVVTGVAAALRVGTFDGQKIAAFYLSNVIPYTLGYMLFWFLSYFGLNDLVAPQITATVANAGFGAIMAALAVSNLDNVNRLYLGTSRPADVSEHTAIPLDTKG